MRYSINIKNTHKLKGTYFSPFLQDVIVSGVPRMYLWSFSSKYPTDHLLHRFENAYFELKQKHNVFEHVSLNANELLQPAANTA